MVTKESNPMFYLVLKINIGRPKILSVETCAVNHCLPDNPLPFLWLEAWEITCKSVVFEDNDGTPFSKESFS